MNRKKNTKSPLNRLSERRAEKLAKYARNHSLNRTVAWLKENGLETSRTSLGNWLEHRRLHEQFLEAQFIALLYKQWLAEKYPDLDEKELDRRAGLMFQTQAMEEHDPKTYLAFSTARHRTRMDHARFAQRERALMLAREKWIATQKTKIDAGLEALYLEVKDNEQARDLFQQFKAAATKGHVLKAEHGNK